MSHKFAFSKYSVLCSIHIPVNILMKHSLKVFAVVAIVLMVFGAFYVLSNPIINTFK